MNLQTQKTFASLADGGHRRRHRPRDGFMTGRSESHSTEAPDETSGVRCLMAPRHTLRIGAWNVRSMNEESKVEQVQKEFNRLKMDIIGLSEVRKTGYGEEALEDGDTLLYSGRNDNLHYQGTGLMMTRKARSALVDWKPVNERLMTARFRGKYTNLSIIVCYAPTNDADPKSKETFYNQLQDTKDKCPRHDVLLIVGDLNAKVGTDNKDYEKFYGKHAIGNMNENGDLLTHFSASNGMVIGGTIFQHKDIHKYTWISPNGIHKNQIDHILINLKWRSSLQDVKVMRSADASTDHYLVMAKLQLKLSYSKSQAPSNVTRWNKAQLRISEERDEFIIETENRFQPLQDTADDLTMDDIWSNIKNIYSSAAEKVLGKCEMKAPAKWMKDETWKMIEERYDIHQKINATKSERIKDNLRRTYSELNKRIKQMVKKDKETYYEEKAQAAQNAADMGNMKTVYDITRELSGVSKKDVSSLKSSDGKLITEQAEIARVWTDHFCTVLNQDDPTNLIDIEEDFNLEQIDVIDSPPTYFEIFEQVTDIKNRESTRS